MVRRAGSADLPLHRGRVPTWLGQRMTRLGAVIVEAIVRELARIEGTAVPAAKTEPQGLLPYERSALSSGVSASARALFR